MPQRKATWSWSDVKPSVSASVPVIAAPVKVIREKVKPMQPARVPGKTGPSVSYVRTVVVRPDVDFASMPYGVKDI